MPIKKPSFEKVTDTDDTPLNSKYIYPRIQEFLQPNDIIFVETGIIPHGFAPSRLPQNTDVNTQTLWGSIAGQRLPLLADKWQQKTEEQFS